MKRYSAYITCTTECEVVVEANSEEEAKQKMLKGEFYRAYLLEDSGLPMNERFYDITITEESFGED